MERDPWARVVAVAMALGWRPNTVRVVPSGIEWFERCDDSPGHRLASIRRGRALSEWRATRGGAL